MDLKVVPLHHHRHHTKACCDLINSEWQRSETARLHSLEASCDTLPTCLVLLKNEKVIGHAKLSKLASVEGSCFVESVVIDKSERSKGYGKILMEKSEEYCKDFLRLRTVYLSTKGQEGFYEKLGYKECRPVSIYGSFVPKKQDGEQIISNTKSDNLVKLCESMTLENNGIVKNNKVTMPLPPPLPFNKEKFRSQVLKTYMRKELN